MNGRDDVTVVVKENGQVWVNGLFAAEVTVGVTDTRDTLLNDLSLHRISSRVMRWLDELDAALDGRVARDVAPGFIDGFNGIDSTAIHGPLVPPLPPEHGADYETGYWAGRHVAAMRRHLHDLDPPTEGTA